MGAPPTARDQAAVLRERQGDPATPQSLTQHGSLKAAPRTALTDDRVAIRALRDGLVAVVRDAEARPARILAPAAELDWPEVRPFVGQSVGPGEVDERRVIDRRMWSQQPNGAEHRELFVGALASVLAHRLERVTSHAGRAVNQRPAGRQHGHLCLLPHLDAPVEGVQA